ncbi:uncharacterized protein [Nicotiana tomentosiformis]|uniref:uncharacterized protein n=1 Tax=Nicotiana tomentosiformis TaxID=4098 RepID=UPI00388CCF9B
MTQYEMRFSKLARQAIWLVPTNRERVKRFIDGLTFQLRLLMTRERVFGATFDEVVDIAHQIEMIRRQKRVEREEKRSRGQGGFNGVPFGGQFHHAQSSSHAPSAQGSSMTGPSSSYSGARGSLQSPPPFAETRFFECGELVHIKRHCPRLLGGSSQQRSQPSTSAPVTSLPAHPARGVAQSTRGHPREGGRSGGGQACFYALPARPDTIASDVEN